MGLNINFAPIIKAAEARREALEKANAAYSEFTAAVHSLQSVCQAFEQMYEAYINLDEEGRNLLAGAIASAGCGTDCVATRSRLVWLYTAKTTLSTVARPAKTLLPKE